MPIADIDPSDAKLLAQAKAAAAARTAADKAAAAAAAQTQATANALRKLTSGSTLTAEEKALLNIGGTSASTSATTSKATTSATTGTSTSTTTSTSTSTTSATTSSTTTWTADDGTVFTDQNAFVNYQTMLKGNAKADYNAAQAAAAKAAQDIADKRDAFALIQDTMKSYGFTTAEVSALTAFAESQIIDPNIGPNQGILNMKALPVYQQRFAGNQERIKKGLNALSEADYLQQEKDYGQYFNEYGVANLATRSQMATMIGNDISATEAKNRIALAVTRVKNSDPTIMTELKRWYPSITDADLVSYFLKPDQALPELQKKVTASEIGAAAVGQGLSDVNALDLATYGVDRATALAGYSDIKNVLPGAKKLSDIYGEAGISYDQAAGEAEFLKQNQDAAEKRRRLKSLERATFSGTTGANTASLGQAPQGMF